MKMIGILTLRKVANYYYSSLAGHHFLFVLVTFLGFVSRLLSILNFALIIKIFLSMFDPDAAVELLNNFLSKLYLEPITTSNLTTYLMIILVTFIFVQFVISKINLLMFRHLRAAVISEICERSVAEPPSQRNYFLYDNYLYGFEALVRSFEILLFYLFLLIFIFSVNLMMGIAVIIFVPALVSLLVFRNRKEAFVQNAIHESREKSIEPDSDPLLPLVHYDKQLVFRINNDISAEMLGGLTIVLIFFLYVTNQEQFSSYGVMALLLVFSIRFAVLYAGELSRQLNIVLKLRTVLE